MQARNVAQAMSVMNTPATTNVADVDTAPMKMAMATMITIPARRHLMRASWRQCPALANLDWADFADRTEDGVYRGFGAPRAARRSSSRCGPVTNESWSGRPPRARPAPINPTGQSCGVSLSCRTRGG